MDFENKSMLGPGGLPGVEMLDENGNPIPRELIPAGQKEELDTTKREMGELAGYIRSNEPHKLCDRPPLGSLMIPTVEQLMELSKERIYSQRLTRILHHPKFMACVTFDFLNGSRVPPKDTYKYEPSEIKIVPEKPEIRIFRFHTWVAGDDMDYLYALSLHDKKGE